MKCVSSGLAAVAALVVAGSALAAPVYSIQSVKAPADASFTQLLGINNGGEIVGTFGAATPQGFTLTLPASFTPENFPGSVQSVVAGVNNAGVTVGTYGDAAGGSHGFIRVGAVFNTLDAPGSAYNRTLGVNGSNVTVGYSSADATGVTGQTAMRQSGNVYTNLGALLPSNYNSQATGINDAGNIVGFYLDTSSTSVGFLDSGGIISKIDPFGSAFTEALGISGTGEIVGFYIDAGGARHGYTDIGGAFSSFDVQGALSTTISGVNDLGEIVGYYTDANRNVIGFVGTPTSDANVPEPATLSLFGMAFAALAARRRKR